MSILGLLAELACILVWVLGMLWKGIHFPITLENSGMMSGGKNDKSAREYVVVAPLNVSNYLSQHNSSSR